MRWFSMALLLMVCAGAAASEMWRWVDERGVVHYSDRPQPGAERVDIKPAQSYPAPAVTTRPGARDEQPAPQREAQASYTRLAILAPSEGETLWNLGATLSVELAIEPPLAQGHQLQIYLDEQRVADEVRGTQFTLSEVYRGEHRLRASIVDERGRELVSSSTVVFYVQQASIQNPNRPSPRPGGG